jgi:hypothetical protein
MMETRNFIFTTILLVLGSFGVPHRTQAVSPAPDGGYPNATTAEGTNALFRLTTGLSNTAIGGVALYNNTTGDYNTANGAFALFKNTTGGSNTADGTSALYHNTTGYHNTATGYQALSSNTTGFENTADGYQALHSNTTGIVNTTTGVNALYHNTTGNSNTAIGSYALFNNSTGVDNTANGVSALASDTTGKLNTALGFHALYNNTTGDGNTVLGANAGSGITTADNVICIGAAGNNVANSCYIGNIFNATSSGGTAVYVNSNGRLGTMTSSRRFKEDIKPIDKASEVLFALKPVAFRYKKDIDPAGTSQLGLVAEDVEKVNPDLVVRDEHGKAYSVRYDQVNAMLLNEFLKEHGKVQKLEAALEAVNQRLQAQDAKIDRANAKIELSRPAQTLVENR